MKYILLIGTFFLSFLANSQTFPIVGRSNSSLTVQDARFSAQLNLFVPRYADTATANAGTNKGNDSLAAVIFTYNTMSLWVRVVDAGSKKWQEVGAGGSGGFTNPMTDEGDMIIGESGGAAGRLAIGPNTYVLTSDGTTFSWQPSAGGGGGWGYTGTVATLTGNSTIDGEGNDLTFDDLGEFTVRVDVLARIIADATATYIGSPNGSNYVNVTDASVEISGTVILSSLAGNGVGIATIDNDGNIGFSAGGGGSGTVTSVAWTTSQGVSASIANSTTTPNITVTLGALTGVTSFNGMVVTANTGVITTGTWNATAIGAIYGGTSFTSYATGDFIYASATNVLSKRSAGSEGYIMTMVSGVPNWAAIPTDNIIVQSNPGTGQPSFYVTNDTLYVKRKKNSTFVSWATDTDSSLVASLSATGTPSGSTFLAGDNTWKVPSGGGDVVKVGTPVNNQVGIWTGDGTIEGVSAVQYNGTTFGIGGTMAASAILDLTSTSQGFLAPRMNTTQQDAISSPATGLLIYNTDSSLFRFYTGSAWTSVGAGGGGGGSGTVTSVGFTGGLISVATATTTPALTVAGTSGGIVYFSSSSTWASSGALTASTIVLGGGAGNSPTSLSLGTANQILAMNNAATGYEHKTLSTSTTAVSNDIGVTLSGANAIVINIPDAATAVRGVLSTGSQSIAGAKTFLAATTLTGFSTSGSNVTSNIASGTANTVSSSTQTELLFEGAATINGRVFERGSINPAIAANASYAGHIIGNQNATEASSGTHALFAGFVINASVFTNAAGGTTNTASLYIAGAPTGITPTDQAVSLWVASGVTRLGKSGTATGSLRIEGATSGAAIITVAAAAGTPTFTLGTTTGTIPSTLTATATLNFDLTAVNYQDLTITVTGAVDGDAVVVGAPNGAVVADVTYFGWVSGTNTVTIRCSRVGGGGASDPASGTFRASVVKY